MKKLNIVQVIDVFDDARNGAVISTQRFVNRLREEGHSVKVISTGNKEVDKIVLPDFYPPVPFVKNVMQQMKMQFAYPDEKKLTAVIRDCDIVHVQFPFWLSMKCIELAQQFNKPIVSTFHVQAEQIAYNINIKNKWFIGKISRFFTESIYNKSSCVICPSAFAREELKRFGLTTRSEVISNGITAEYFKERNPQTSSHFTILNVGRMASEKRQEMLIDAVSKSKHKNKIKVELVGDGPLYDKLKSLANKKLPNQVEFYYLPKEVVIQKYIDADLYVHCADVEVESMSTMEAMACGLPMLIAETPLSAAKQFALNGKFLFKTIAELTQKIDFLIEHKDFRMQASADYARKAKDYEFEHCFKLLENVYYDLVG